MFGGIVEWEKENKDKHSVSVQLYDEDYFKELKILLIIVSDKRKDTSSTDGMKLSKETSSLFNVIIFVKFKFRIENVLPERIADMKKYLKDRNYEKIFELTIKDSNNFHAICRDTYPTIYYLNDNSNFIMKIVDFINNFHKKIIV